MQEVCEEEEEKFEYDQEELHEVSQILKHICAIHFITDRT